MQGFSNILIPRTAKWQLYIFEVGDSSHVTWLESDSSRKFKDLWLAWLNKENDLTWLGLEIQWLETWPSWLGRTWLYNNSNYYKSLQDNLVNKTQATEPVAEVIRVCAVHEIARAQEHSVPNTGSKRISRDVWINTSNQICMHLQSQDVTTT